MSIELDMHIMLEMLHFTYCWQNITAIYNIDIPLICHHNSPLICICNVKNVAGHVYDNFDWPVILGVIRSHLLGWFHYSFKGTINYFRADIYWFKDMI